MNHNLPKTLKKLRLEKNLHQKDVAKILNTTQQAYSKYERGDREPDLSNLITLADYYRTSLDYLAGRYDKA